jgi:hypothetical protein
MVKLKYDVSESDPEEAKAQGTFEAIKPGLYLFEIEAVNVGFSKGDDGKPDKTKPRIEVVFSCLDSKYKNAKVWGYFVQKGHPSYDKKAAQKFDQLLLAVKFTDGKKNRQGELDTDKHIKGKKVVVRVRAGKNQEGEARGEFGSVFPPETPTGSSDTTGGTADDELIDGDDEMIEAGDDEMMEEGEEIDWDARKAELAGADVPTLKEIAKEYEVKITGMKKSEVVDALIEFEKANVPAGDDDEILDDDEEIIEDDSNGVVYLTREGLAALETPEIARIAKEDFDLTIKGKKKSEVIEMIIIAQAAPGDVGEDGMPF